jgi:hypothetical protein
MKNYDQHSGALSREKRVTFTIITISCSILLSIWIANTILRKVEKYRAKRWLTYGDTLGTEGLGPGGLLKAGFEGLVHDGYGGAVKWKTNNQGFRYNKDVSQMPPPGILRILSLGDSFIAGMRIDQADTFSKILEGWSTKNLAPTEVLISMIEHPDNGLKYLRQYGYKWSPHIAMLGITLGNDIAQSYVSRHPTSIGFRHGLEKFSIPDHCFVQRGSIKKAIIKKLYDLSRSRFSKAIFKPSDDINNWYGRKEKLKLFDAQNGLGMYIKNPPQAIKDAYQRLFQILLEYKEFCGKHNIKFVVLIFPQRFQVQPGDWSATVIAKNLNPAAFDLMRPNELISNFCLSESIPCIDPTEAMKRYHQDTGQNLYLPGGDMHWSRIGNRAWFLGAQADLKIVLQNALESPLLKAGSES